MMRKTILATTLLAAAVALPALAAEDPIAQRQAIMKDNGKAIGTLAGMAKGQIPFDALAAEMAIRVMNASANGFGALFPEGSETGGDTEAKPEIWSNRADFEVKLAEFRAATEGAMSAPPADLDGVKAALGALGKTCGSCHETYRVKKQ